MHEVFSISLNQVRSVHSKTSNPRSYLICQYCKLFIVIITIYNYYINYYYNYFYLYIEVAQTGPKFLNLMGIVFEIYYGSRIPVIIGGFELEISCLIWPRR